MGVLINRIVPEFEAESFRKKAASYKIYNITNSDLSAFYRISDGTLSPLEGPMDQAEFDRVLEGEVVERGNELYAWTVPIAFPVFKKDSDGFNIGAQEET